jgi:hypothetical protein
MAQSWTAPTEAGALRLVNRLHFYAATWPQPLCTACPWTRDCHDLLEAADVDESWLVRDPVTTTSDGRRIDACARGWYESARPADITVFRHRLSAQLLAEHVSRPGEPLRRPRERGRLVDPTDAVSVLDGA